MSVYGTTAYLRRIISASTTGNLAALGSTAEKYAAAVLNRMFGKIRHAFSLIAFVMLSRVAASPATPVEVVIPRSALSKSVANEMCAS